MKSTRYCAVPAESQLHQRGCQQSVPMPVCGLNARHIERKRSGDRLAAPSSILRSYPICSHCRCG
eukprot:6912670-Pyramimonas_sp.AAC.1